MIEQMKSSVNLVRNIATIITLLSLSREIEQETDGAVGKPNPVG